MEGSSCRESDPVRNLETRNPEVQYPGQNPENQNPLQCPEKQISRTS